MNLERPQNSNSNRVISLKLKLRNILPLFFGFYNKKYVVVIECMPTTDGDVFSDNAKLIFNILINVNINFSTNKLPEHTDFISLKMVTAIAVVFFFNFDYLCRQLIWLVYFWIHYKSMDKGIQRNRFFFLLYCYLTFSTPGEFEFALKTDFAPRIWTVRLGWCFLQTF